MTYKGFKIEWETNKWAVKYCGRYRYYIDFEKVYNADSIEQAQLEIDELINLNIV